MSGKDIKTNTSKRRGPMGNGPIGARFEKPEDFKGTFSKLLNYLKPYTFKLTIVMIFAIGSTVFSIVGPKILGKATTKNI